MLGEELRISWDKNDILNHIVLNKKAFYLLSERVSPVLLFPLKYSVL